MRTPAQHLADILLDQPVEEWIAERRNQDKPVSWRRISLELRDATDGKCDIAPATLLAWHDAAQVAA